MAHVTADRVLQVVTPVATTAFTLGAPITGFRGVANIPAIANNDTLYYSAWGVDASGTPTGDWENGVGTYQSATGTLNRTTIISSSNANAAVTFTAMTVWLANSLIASMTVVEDPSGEAQFIASSAAAASINIPHGVNPTTPANGDVWSTTDGFFARVNGVTKQMTPHESFTQLTATQQSTATGLANITQLVAPMVANGVYAVDCLVTFQSAATTTGLNLGFTSPAGCVCRVEVVVPLTSTAAASQLRTTFPNAAATNTGNVLGTGVTAINSNHTARISGIITNGATAGNFQPQFATEVAASAVTLQIGSRMLVRRIA